MDSEKQSEAVRFEDFVTNAPALFDEAEAGKDITVERNGALFRLAPVRPSRRRRRRLSANDPLFDIVGIGRSHGPTDVSGNKRHYLSDAIADQHPAPQP